MVRPPHDSGAQLSLLPVVDAAVRRKEASGRSSSFSDSMDMVCDEHARSWTVDFVMRDEVDDVGTLVHGL